MDDEQFNKDKYRFKVAHNEALIGCALAVINIIWWYGFAYGLGSKPPEEYQYVFGLPAWFFWSCVVGFLVMTMLVIIVVKFMLKEIPFDDEHNQKDTGEKEHGS